MRVLGLLLLCVFARPAFASSFATQVVSYTAGTNVLTGYDDPLSSLGEPARSTGTGPFDGDVTPFNAPYTADQVVGVGAGGELVLRFDHQVTDDPENLYGIDLLIYGNAFLGLSFETFLADGTVFGEPARVAVSQDGSLWIDATGLFADDLFPTLAYQDPPGPFSSGGTIPTSFTRPVDPSLDASDFNGLDTAQIAALYGGGAGGLGIDLGALGLPWIEYVRIWQPSGDGYASEIDAIADVPEPASRTLLGVAALALISRRARTRRPSR
ncbi:MAG: hypothetical protein WEF50_13635 [Myxococcota bacterium]